MESKVFAYMSMIRAFVFGGFVSENVKVVFLRMLKMFTNSVPSVTVEEGRGYCHIMAVFFL